jgi:hypothetical protein
VEEDTEGEEKLIVEAELIFSPISDRKEYQNPSSIPTGARLYPTVPSKLIPLP